MSSSTSSDGGPGSRPGGLVREVQPVAHDITGLIGNTPLIEPPRLVEGPGARLMIKHEGFNPGGSIRDRTVLEILDNAAASGLIYRGDEIVIAGASNSAVSALMIGNARGYPVVVFHPENGTPRLLGLLERSGARLVLTSAAQGMAGAVEAAADYAQSRPGRIYIDPGRREALCDAIHQIAREILLALGGLPLAAFVTSVSTGATLRHVARQLRKHYPDLQVVGVRIETSEERHFFYDDVATPIQWPPANDVQATILSVSEADAWQQRQRLGQHSGLMLGPKGAAAILGALQLRPSIPDDQVIVSLSIDGGRRYFGAEPPELRAALGLA